MDFPEGKNPLKLSMRPVEVKPFLQKLYVFAKKA